MGEGHTRRQDEHRQNGVRSLTEARQQGCRASPSAPGRAICSSTDPGEGWHPHSGAGQRTAQAPEKIQWRESPLNTRTTKADRLPQLKYRVLLGHREPGLEKLQGGMVEDLLVVKGCDSSQQAQVSHRKFQSKGATGSHALSPRLPAGRHG